VGKQINFKCRVFQGSIKLSFCNYSVVEGSDDHVQPFGGWVLIENNELSLFEGLNPFWL